MNKFDYSIVIPVYKSGVVLFQLIDRINDVFTNKLSGCTYQVVFVNDSPFDKVTCDVLMKIVSIYEFASVIELTKNYGQHPAILCGMSYSSGDYVITMDDDMQHDPADIPKLIEMKEHDVVIAKFENKKHSKFKIITSSIKGHFDRMIIGKPKNIMMTSFRLFKRQVVNNILKINTSYPIIPALIFSVTCDVVNVNVEHYARKEGGSNYTIIKMVKLFLNLLIGNSSFLLRLVGYSGFFVAMISFVFACIIVAQRFFYDVTILGWSSIMVAILFFGGVIMFALGVIGEYLIRIIHTSENRPHYFVRDVIGCDSTWSEN